jgi:hypothetical protein
MNQCKRSCESAYKPFIPSCSEAREECAAAVLQSIARFQHPHNVLHRCQEPVVLAWHLPTSITSIPANEATEMLDGGGEDVFFLVN